MFNSLAQSLLKMTAPGVPDVYQGNEFWQFTLVDPDNRRPVDYGERKRLLDELQRGMQSEKTAPQRLSEFLANPEDGRLKMYLTSKTLNLRREESMLFQRGSYIPLKVSGPKSQHVVAFAREHEGRTAIVVVPRLCASLLTGDVSTPCAESVWGDTTVEQPPSRAQCYHNLFSGECIPKNEQEQTASLPISRMLRDFPVALLLSAVPDLH